MSKSGKMFCIYVAFVSGAAVMIVEILLGRIFSTYFGSHAYTWGNLIGVILGGLALGYSVGGKMSDRFPTGWVPGALLGCAGSWIAFLPLFTTNLCPKIQGWGYSEATSGCLAAFFLALVPMVLLGAVFPYVTRLSVSSIDKVGNLVGKLGAVSTLGSLAGAFLTTFVLLDVNGPGTRLSLKGLGALLILSSFPLFLIQTQMKRTLIPIQLLLLFWLSDSFSAKENPRNFDFLKLIAKKETPFHQVCVFENTFGDLNRYLTFCNDNDAFQTGISLSSDKTILPYTDFFLKGWEFNPQIKTVAVLGGGGGVIPKSILKEHPTAKVDVVEVDRGVTLVARDFFEYPKDSASLKTIHSDGRYFLASTSSKYDYIAIDCYTGGAKVPEHLITKEFFELVKSRLTPSGVLAINLYSRPNANLYLSVIKTIDVVFGYQNTSVFLPALLESATIPAKGPMNMMIFVSSNKKGRKDKTQFFPLVSKMAPILSDDFSVASLLID